MSVIVFVLMFLLMYIQVQVMIICVVELVVMIAIVFMMCFMLYDSCHCPALKHQLADPHVVIGSYIVHGCSIDCGELNP